MSLTVRFPSGLAITYNKANYFNHGEHIWHLYEFDNLKGWVASISTASGAIIEGSTPCRVEKPDAPLAEALRNWSFENSRLANLCQRMLKKLADQAKAK